MKKQAIINPSTNEVITEVMFEGKEEIEAKISRARQAFDHGFWPNLALRERKNIILKISLGILDKAAELAALETQNTGKPIKETTFMDIPSSAKTFEFFANNLERFLKEERVAISQESEARLIRQPHGVVVLIVPWNYPLLIASWKVAQALACGNTVILKPSSLTPLSALELEKIINSTGIPAGAFSVVNASGDVAGEALCADPRVDMVSFTGSNEVGKKIIGYGARSPKKMIMELGGKSACVILDDADVEVAVNSSLASIFLNQGQMCTAMSRIFVDHKIYDTFLNSFVDKARRIKLGPGADFETQMGPLISESQRLKVLDFVERAKKEGTRLLCGGRIPENPALKKGFFFEPAVFVEATPQMRIFQEEVFGPVACVNRFFKPEDAIALANQTDFGLACSVWSKDPARAQVVAEKINAGISWINTYGMFYDQVPYGGFKQSGFGKELGEEGFLEYSRLKNVIIDKTIDGKPPINYWYGF